MVVKSTLEFKYINNLGNIFGILRRHKLRLNASKCSFGVRSRKFLGYMVTHCGIEINPNQIKAINSLQPTRNPKEVQKLTGLTVALNRFISLSANRCRHFFQLLNKWKGFEWTEECVLAFSSWRNTYLGHPLCKGLRWMRLCLLTLLWLPMQWAWCLCGLIVVYRGQFIMWASHYFGSGVCYA